MQSDVLFMNFSSDADNVLPPTSPTIQASLPHTNKGITQLLQLLSSAFLWIYKGLNMNSSDFRNAKLCS
jgi:hypothetical protein